MFSQEQLSLVTSGGRPRIQGSVSTDTYGVFGPCVGQFSSCVNSLKQESITIYKQDSINHVEGQRAVDVVVSALQAIPGCSVEQTPHNSSADVKWKWDLILTYQGWHFPIQVKSSLNDIEKCRKLFKETVITEKQKEHEKYYERLENLEKKDSRNRYDFRTSRHAEFLNQRNNLQEKFKKTLLDLPLREPLYIWTSRDIDGVLNLLKVFCALFKIQIDKEIEKLAIFYYINYRIKSLIKHQKLKILEAIKALEASNYSDLLERSLAIEEANKKLIASQNNSCRINSEINDFVDLVDLLISTISNRLNTHPKKIEEILALQRLKNVAIYAKKSREQIHDQFKKVHDTLQCNLQKLEKKYQDLEKKCQNLERKRQELENQSQELELELEKNFQGFKEEFDLIQKELSYSEGETASIVAIAHEMLSRKLTIIENETGFSAVDTSNKFNKLLRGIDRAGRAKQTGIFNKIGRKLSLPSSIYKNNYEEINYELIQSSIHEINYELIGKVYYKLDESKDLLNKVKPKDKDEVLEMLNTIVKLLKKWENIIEQLQLSEYDKCQVYFWKEESKLYLKNRIIHDIIGIIG